MVSQELLEYVTNAKAQGHTQDSLRTVLLQSGYAENDINEAFSSTTNTPINTQNGSYEKNIRKNIQGIKQRNIAIVIILYIITFGIYTLYWAYSTAKELQANTQASPNPKLLLSILLVPTVSIIGMLSSSLILLTILLLVSIPTVTIMMFLLYWKHTKAIEELTGFNHLLLFLLWIIFAPVALILSQLELNKVAAQ